MANQEHLDLLAQGVAAWNQWKGDTHETAPGVRWNFCYDADLSDADLRGVDLNGVNLGRCDLSRANFSGASLVGASLTEAELFDANFTGARLRRANLSGVNGGGADFSNADLSHADLCGSELSEVCFQGANLSGANLSRAYLSKVRLQGADLSEANLSKVSYGTLFPHAQIRQAKQAGALVRSANPPRQKAARGTRVFSNRKTQGEEIILFPHVNNSRVLRVLAISFLFVMSGIWFLQRPGNLVNVVMVTLTLLLFGLGGMIFLLQYLRQLFSRTPLLVINDEGIEYFCPWRLERIDPGIGLAMPRMDTMLTWKEIGAIGVIQKERTNSFVVYASAERWRSDWSPSLRLSERLLPISATQVIALVQERYQAQLATNHIIPVELVDETELRSRPSV